MQYSQWSPEIIVISLAFAVVMATLGFFIAAQRFGKRISAQEATLQQLGQEKAEWFEAKSVLQAQLSEAEQQTQQLQINEGKLQEKLAGMTEEVARVSERLQSAEQKLEQATQMHHETARQLEVAQTQSRAYSEQGAELRARLDKAEQQQYAAQKEINRLKDELAHAGQRNQGLETSEREAREQLAETKLSLRELSEQYASLQGRYQSLSNEFTELNTSLKKREEHYQEQKAQLTEAQKSLTQEFENLANKIFEEKGKTFTQTSQSSIDAMLKPFREQIDGFQKRINEVHDASLQGNTSLNAEIRKVLEIGLQMSKEANSLTSALKGDSQQRGAWGEAQLRRTLEMSGLVQDAHYEVQSAFKDADGRSKQTDYLIKLPDGKHIIIDSKVSLVAYDRAVAAETPEEYQLAMAEHVKSVRRHIDDLASKDYTNLVGMRSPNFVLMFMPIEPAYIEAMKHNKDLFEYGYKKNIVLVSHTTLIPILRTVSNLWMIERSNAEAREISERAGEIYNQVCTVAERLGKLGNTLNTVSNHYNDTVTALAGKQGLYGKVERFAGLSAKVSKTLPVLEPTHMDFEADRLAMIVEAIEDEVPEENSLPKL